MAEQHTPVFPSLTTEVCSDLSEWANPMGQGVLPQERLQEILAALKTARAQAQSMASKLPRAEALDYMSIEQALLAAVTLVEVVHQPQA